MKEKHQKRIAFSFFLASLLIILGAFVYMGFYFFDIMPVKVSLLFLLPLIILAAGVVGFMKDIVEEFR